jgi:probable selenium-dependent hydroxylase accessory protein YqeC
MAVFALDVKFAHILFVLLESRDDMKLYEALDIDLEKKTVISIVGGGGKTTAMYELASELKALGKKVLVTTTTAIMMPHKNQYDRFLCMKNEFESEELFNAEKGSVTVLVSEFIRADKVKGIEAEMVDKVYERVYYDFIIVEADGSKRKPIKAPREGEPVIPQSTKKVIGVIGLDALDKDIDESTVHRVEIFKSITGTDSGQKVDPTVVAKLINHPEGLFKNTQDSEKYLILNKADDDILKEKAKEIATFVSHETQIKKTIISSLDKREISIC